MSLEKAIMSLNDAIIARHKARNESEDCYGEAKHYLIFASREYESAVIKEWEKGVMMREDSNDLLDDGLEALR